MECTADSLNLIRKMNMMRTELMMKQRQKEMKEQDLLSQIGNSHGDGDLDCTLKLGLPDDNPTHPSTVFYGASGIHPQVGDNHRLISRATAFRPWGIPISDHVPSNNNDNITGFIDFLGSAPVLACRRPPQTIETNPTSSNPVQSAADPFDGSENGKSCRMCRRSNTPLWRNGPHGPKTLCNACGIRFKKLEKKALGITEAFPRPGNGIKKPKL